jgi:hypothetical protein
LGALRVVDEADPVDDRHRLEAVLDALEGRGLAPDRLGIDTEQEAGRDGGQGVTGIVAARDRQLLEGHDPAIGTRCRRASAGKRQALEVLRHDPAVDDPDPAGPRRLQPVADAPRGAEVSIGRDDGIVGIQDEGASGIDELGKTALDSAIRLERAVAVQVIGGHVRVDGDGRPLRQGRQLEFRQLHDGSFVRAQLGQPLDEGRADVAAQDHPVIGVAGQDRGGQGRGGRLALRARDPDRRRRAEAQEEIGLRDERR